MLMINKNNHKIIFGLKVRQLRIEKNLSYSDLAESTGISSSYLNEIEKGKKFPKEDKIQLLAIALQTTAEELESANLPKSLAPVEDLLQSNFLNELPLHLFGIDLAKVVEIIANAPLRVGAFVSTLLELSRNYALREENFYFGALRSYLELHNNYFDEIEEAVKAFVKQNKVPTGHSLPPHYLRHLLERKFGYEVIEDGLKKYPDLQNIRSVYSPKSDKLLVNGNLNDQQRAFLFGKEIGFNALQLKERANTSTLLRVKTFEEALNHFKAGYFSAALLMNKDNFTRDIEAFLSKPLWDGDYLLQLLHKYQVSPETLFQRLTNILPHTFGLDNLFFLRIIYQTETGKFDMNRELHLNRRHHPHSNSLEEHYCRRWISVTLLQDLERIEKQSQSQDEIGLAGAQRSKYFGTKDEYLCISIAKRAGGKTISVTIGILIEQDTKKHIHFIDDPDVVSREVNTTCERCGVEHCAERAIAPIMVERKLQRQRIQDDLKKIMAEE